MCTKDLTACRLTCALFDPNLRELRSKPAQIALAPSPTLGLLSPRGAVQVVPRPGTFVAFDSASVPHEVLATRRNRLAVVGWLLQRREESQRIRVVD